MPDGGKIVHRKRNKRKVWSQNLGESLELGFADTMLIEQSKKHQTGGTENIRIDWKEENFKLR